MALAMLAAVFGVVLFVPVHTAKADAGDNYPTKWRDPVAQDSVVDDWHEYNRECTSWVAWALHDRNGYEMPFHDNASGWGDKATAIGFAPDSNPAVGAVAWWAANAPGASAFGHVAWVSSVNTGGGITVEQYNLDFTGHYSTSTFAKGSSKWPTGFIHFKDLSGSTTPTPTPTSTSSSSILALKSGLAPDGAIETFAATQSWVTEGWYHNGGDGVHTFPIINIAQNDIVGVDKLNIDNTELLYTAVSDGVWESSWVAGSGVVTHAKPVNGLSGVRGVIAENTFDGNGYRVHHLYILASDGPYEAYWKDSEPSHPVHVGRLVALSGGIAFTHSIGPDGSEQLYVAVPTWVYEISWFPNGTINSRTVINIPQGDIHSVDKGANLPDGGQLLYTTTSTTVWQTYWPVGGGFSHGTVATGQSNAFQGLKSITPDGWHHVYLAEPDHVQEYKWMGSSSGGGEIIRISQGNIKAIAQQLDGSNQLLFTAAGTNVWETWWNGTTGYNTSPDRLFAVTA
jgi:surface antigen